MPSKAKASTATYWVRVKPYNPARGHVIKRYHAAGRMWHGGDGLTQIPHWVKVTEQLAKKLATFHQSDRDPYAPRIFDIVTEEKKRFIEKQEDEIRRQIRGGVAINAMPDVSARSLDLTGGVGVNHLEDALQDETGDIALPMRRSFRSSFGSDDLRDAGLLPSEKPPVDLPPSKAEAAAPRSRRSEAGDSNASSSRADIALVREQALLSQAGNEQDTGALELNADGGEPDIVPGEMRYVRGSDGKLKAIPVTEDDAAGAGTAAYDGIDDDEGPVAPQAPAAPRRRARR